MPRAISVSSCRILEPLGGNDVKIMWCRRFKKAQIDAHVYQHALARKVVIPQVIIMTYRRL